MKSKAVRAAEKRREQRQSREAALRLKRAALVSGASGAVVLGIGTLVVPVAVPVLAAAGGGALLLGVGSLFRPVRRRSDEGDFSKAELADLPGDSEDWLLARRDGLPLDCRPPLDRIFQRLGDLQPNLAELAPHSSAAWEARRLLGDHLPRLVLAFEAMPASMREEEARLRAGLETVADALDQLCREVCRNPMMTFETQGRFLESRYRGEDPRLVPGEGRGQNLPSKRVE